MRLEGIIISNHTSDSIPTWAYVLTSLVIITILVAYRKRDLKDSICHEENQKPKK